MIRTENISKHFGGIHALRSVSITCHNGQVTALIGPNGSGKSTLVNVLTGLIAKDAGSVTFDGTVGRTFQDSRLWGHMTVYETLLMSIGTKTPLRSLFVFRENRARVEELLSRVGLLPYQNTQARHLSYGQRKLLEIARALGTNATTLLLDEPFAGLFPEMVQVVKDIIKTEKNLGKAIVLVEHDMSVIRELADYAYVLDGGELIAEGAVEVVLANDAVVTAYLGK